LSKVVFALPFSPIIDKNPPWGILRLTLFNI